MSSINASQVLETKPVGKLLLQYSVPIKKIFKNLFFKYFNKKMLSQEEFNKLIFNKYRVKNLIHSSGFADVYEGINEKENIPVALKLEKRKNNFNILESEAFLLINLKGYGIPKIITYGRHGLYNVLIEELLGLSIGHIYDSYIRNKFDLKDICMIALQSLDRIEYIHSKLVIHRDIKPHNLVLGRNDPNVIYLIDFGLSRKYRSSRTGKHIKFNNLKLTFGSLRYLSINGNKGLEQSRRDDLESLGYMLIFLATGTIPWIQYEDIEIDVVKKYLLVYKIKKNISSEKLCKGLPDEMIEYINYCKGLHFEEDPDYNHLRSLFLQILNKKNLKNDMNFSFFNIILNESQRNNNIESYNKNIIKRSVTPHIRLLNKIKTNLLKEKSKTILENENYKIGRISHLQKPINYFYKDNEDNINNEKEGSINEGENKKLKKIKHHLESESTKERDLRCINTDKSLSTSCDKKEKSKNKNRKKRKRFYKDNTNIKISHQPINELNIESGDNIKIVDNEESKILELNYDDTEFNFNQELLKFEQNKETDNLGDIYNNKVDEKINNINLIDENNFYIEKKAESKNDRDTNYKKQFKNIKFISNNNFWDDDIEEITEDRYQFNIYNNINLACFDIPEYNLNRLQYYNIYNKNNQIMNNNYNNNNNKKQYNKNIIDNKKTKNIEQKININLNNNNIGQKKYIKVSNKASNYQVISKKTNYNNNNNDGGIPVGKNKLNNLIQKQKELKNNKFRTNRSYINLSENQTNKSINKTQNIQKNKFQQNYINNLRTTKENMSKTNRLNNNYKKINYINNNMILNEDIHYKIKTNEYDDDNNINLEYNIAKTGFN